MEFSRQTNGGMNLRSKKSDVGGLAVKGARKALGDVNARRPFGVLSKNIKPFKDDSAKPSKPTKENTEFEKPLNKKHIKPVKQDFTNDNGKTKEVEEIDADSQLPVQKDDIADINMFPLKPLTENVEEIDSEDTGNPQLVSEYIVDIYRYLWNIETKFPIQRHYLDGRSEINGRMRAILVDWLIQVHAKFQLLQETLYLTVSIVDRFLQVQEIRKSKLQLVGVAAMFIAAKYEEMYAPEVGDFVYITDKAYSKTEILKMEGIILRKLDFNLSKPLPLHFLRRDSKAGNVDATMHTLAKYLLELMLPEYDVVHHLPSLMAAAALKLALKLTDNSTWSETLVYYSNYTEEDINPVVRSLCQIVLRREKNKNAKTINQKYATAKLLKISTIPELKSDIVVRLAAGVDEVKE